MEAHESFGLDKNLTQTTETGVNQVRRHSLTQLKLPKKSNGADFSDKSSTPKTPTPTRTVDRLLRNCDAIGLFEELKHVNPFDETFRQAVENKDATFLSSSAPMKGLTPEDELNTPQYPSLLKDKASTVEKIPDKEEKPSTNSTKTKYRSLIKLKNESKKVIRPILPKPVQSHSAKEKLKAFILKDLSPVIVDKTSPIQVKSCKTSKKSLKTSNKPTDSNREAAKRYRERVKLLQQQLETDNLTLRRKNADLVKENAALKKQIEQLLARQVQKTPIIIQQIPKILINNEEAATNGSNGSNKEHSQVTAVPIYTIITSNETVIRQNNVIIDDKKDD